MKQHWSTLEPRQQIAAAATAAAIVAIVVGATLLQLHARETRAQQGLQRQLIDLAQAQTLAQQYQARHMTTPATADSVDLVTIVSGNLRDAGLQPTRLQQNSADELQVRLDAAPYDQLITALAKLEQNSAVTLTRVTLTPGLNGATGASLSLRKRQ
jgi:type II secretory pathway component PulM